MPFNKKILLVDDEEGFVSIIKEALEVRGFGVVTVKSAVEAGLELSGEKPDLILMDIRLPNIDGLEACTAIKNNPSTREIPVIIISAVSDESVIKKAYETGVIDYFIKPVDIEKLVNRIKEILKV